MRKPSKVEKADIRVAHAAAARSSMTVKILGSASEVADQPPLITITVATTLIGLALRNRTLANTGGRMLAAELLATWMKGWVKHRVDRTRPRVMLDDKHYGLSRGSSHESGESSFPSGHTAGAVAVARAMTRDYPRAAAPALLTAGAIAAIQVPRAQHFLSDIAAGGAIGLIAEAIVRGAERGLARALTPADQRVAL